MCDLFQTKIGVSSSQQWNGIFTDNRKIIDENNKVKEKIFDKKETIRKDIRMNMITISLLTFIFMPFLFLYMLFFVY